jgi:SAM-dependent methyltransferase
MSFRRLWPLSDASPEEDDGGEAELIELTEVARPCSIGKDDEMAIAGEGAPAAPTTPKGPRTKVRSEVQRLVQAHSPQGAVLEIAADVRDLATPSIAYFDGAERHVIGLGEDAERDGVTFHDSEPHDMGALFPDGAFGAVISNRSLARDAKFMLTAAEIRRVLAPGGLAIFITPCFSKVPNDAGVVAVGRRGNPFTDVTVTYRVHSTPDYWRISPQAMKHVILDGFDVQEVRVMMMPPHVFGVGLKAA